MITQTGHPTRPPIGRRIPVVVATVFPDRHGRLDACLKSLIAQRPVEADIILVQNGSQAADACARWEAHGLTVLRPGKNLGAAGGWNLGLTHAFTAGAEVALVLGDDMVIRDVWALTAIREAFLLCRRQLRALHNRGYSGLCMSREVWDEVGPFDDGYWPAYFEDNDHHYRCKLADIPWDEILVETDHGEGSSTIRADDGMQSANAQTFILNQERHRLKWGGGPHQETFTVPWNGGPPTSSTRDLITAELRDRIEMAHEAVHA